MTFLITIDLGTIIESTTKPDQVLKGQTKHSRPSKENS